MRLKKYILLLCAGAVFSCTDLDIPPKNILGEQEIFGSTDGVMTYIARIYSILPMEDFRYYYPGSPIFNNPDTKYAQMANLTGESVGWDTKGAEIEQVSYWDQPFAAIREVNMFLETLPAYEEFHSPDAYRTYIAEAHFARAFIYYSLVKRYGGVPIVDHVIDYPATVDYEGTKLSRDSEEDTWDFISSDLDYAIANLPETNQKGRANKYAAAAFKSRAMLHAGSIAKYNTVDETYNGVRICGIPSSRANDYFKQAYDASLLVDDGGYRLFTDYWVAGNKTAQATNFGAVFLLDTYENIFVRYYSSPESVHSYDDSAQPRQTSTGGNNSELNPTLDFVEMFEGFDKDAAGRFENFDASGHYKLYDSPLDAFIDCEPRLRATIILPMDEFRGEVIDLRRGIWTGDAGNGISRLLPEGYIGNYTSVYDESSDLKMSNGYTFNDNPANYVILKDGSTMKRAGDSGVVSEWDFGGVSGFLVRKYLNPDQTDNNGNKSTQSWIEIRYAEVLLNRAEAAFELYLAGQSGVSYREEAFRCINLIRSRAGATELAAVSDLDDINIVRTERRKELAFENKTYWDLKRWRIIYDEQNGRRWRTLGSFYSTDADKYFLDVIYQESRGGYNYIYNFDTRQYYQQIPNGETIKNPNCKQNPGY